MSTIEFNTKLDTLATMLQAFAYNLTKNSDDAKDLFQETSMRALINRDKFRPDTNFKAWMFTIMKNIFINNYRKKVKQKTIIDATDNMFYINSGSNSIRNNANSNMVMDELMGMMDEIDENLRIPFMMHYKGYKYQEIADNLELPLGTVKSRIFFARKEMRELILARYGSAHLVREKDV